MPSRRDFTINALFYDPTTEEILDFCDGLADLQGAPLRMIGDPEQRYREDPVRMLRAVRLAAKLGLKIEADTRAPIKRLAPLLANVPSARLFEEMMKLLMSGHATACLLQLRHEGLHHGLLPMLDVILEQPMGERFVMMALQSTDERIREDKPVSPGFLFAALLWHEVLAAWKIAQEEGLSAMPALFKAMDHVIQVQAEKLSIPRRFGADMKEIWALQPRLLARSGRRPYSVLAHPRFRAGYDFLVLRCDSGEVEAEVAEWWDNFQKADEDTRKQMLLPERGPKRRRRRRKPRGEGGDCSRRSGTRRILSAGVLTDCIRGAGRQSRRPPMRRSCRRSRNWTASRKAVSSRARRCIALRPSAMPSQPDFINAVARLDTALDARPLLRCAAWNSRTGTAAGARCPMRRAPSTSICCCMPTVSCMKTG